ncbi:hypothetical protein C0993_012467 [Termitomyces sp. T159_Od127]|nr:hypothetical protein C0993_012467 [Termitomyces sp. T159_Od127]
MRAPRIRDNTYKNWRLFHDIICDGNVPIILVITGLEQEKIMGQWWFENKGTFQKYGMHPNGVACITDTRSSATRRNQLKSGDHRLVEEHETRASAFGGFGTSPFGAVNSAFGGMPSGHDTSDRSVEESGYSKSQVEMQRQIKTCCLEHAYKVPPVELFKEIAEVEYEVRWCGLASPIERKTFRTEAVAGIRKLVQRCEVSEKEALEWGEALSKNQTYAFL